MKTEKKIAIILGTRPEIIKMSPIIKECAKRELDFIVIHTGQHYSYEMDRIIFEDLDLPPADYNLDVGSGSHAWQTGMIMQKIETILLEEKVDVVLVQGDTNTVLAGALAASKLNLTVGHVEAGLRSYDRTMPEEVNRVVADHISDLMFTPTKAEKDILLGEGIPEEKIFITGNTIVDAIDQGLKIAAKKSKILEEMGLNRGEYMLATMHRQENVDVRHKLEAILEGMQRVYSLYKLPIIIPLHPRTVQKLRDFKLELPEGLKVIKSLGFLDFLQLESNARIVMTDSGGVQEETCIMRIPCVTLRENTERPETLEVGSNILAGTDPERLVQGVEEMNKREMTWENPFGDGRTAEHIADLL